MPREFIALSHTGVGDWAIIIPDENNPVIDTEIARFKTGEGTEPGSFAERILMQAAINSIAHLAAMMSITKIQILTPDTDAYRTMLSHAINAGLEVDNAVC